MGSRYLIDTSVVVKYLENLFSPAASQFLDNVVDNDCILSFITEIELQVWKSSDPNDIKIRQQFLTSSKVIHIDNNIIKTSIDIRKQCNLKIPDSIIAATAINYGFTLLSTNDKDFNKVLSLGLIYLNPLTIL